MSLFVTSFTMLSTGRSKTMYTSMHLPDQQSLEANDRSSTTGIRLGTDSLGKKWAKWAHKDEGTHVGCDGIQRQPTGNTTLWNCDRGRGESLHRHSITA